MESYRVLIKPSAAKEIETLPTKKLRQRVVACIRGLAHNPRPTDCKGLSGIADRYRLRQGVCRIVYSVSDQELIVYVIRVGYRKDVHRLRAVQ